MQQDKFTTIYITQIIIYFYYIKLITLIYKKQDKLTTIYITQIIIYFYYIKLITLIYKKQDKIYHHLYYGNYYLFLLY